jgi:hypothetical protein
MIDPGTMANGAAESSTAPPVLDTTKAREIIDAVVKAERAALKRGIKIDSQALAELAARLVFDCDVSGAIPPELVPEVLDWQEKARRWVEAGAAGKQIARPAWEVLPDPVSASTFLAQDFPRADWLADNLLVAGLMNAIIGPTHSGKTAAGIKVSIDVARGGRCILFVEEEATEKDLWDRLTAGGLNPAAEPDVTARFLIYAQQGVNLLDPLWRLKLEKHVFPRLRGGVAFFDTWSDVTPGMDQKEQVEVAKALDYLREQKNAHGFAACPFFHTPKLSIREGGEPTLADIFGSVTIANKLDQAFFIQPKAAGRRGGAKSKRRSPEVSDAYGAGLEVNAEPDLSGLVEVFHLKSRGGGRGRLPKREGRIRPVQVDTDPETGLAITAGIFEWCEESPEQRERERRRAQLREVVIDYCTKHQCFSRNEVAKAIGGKRTLVLDAIRQALDRRLLLERPDGLLVPNTHPREVPLAPIGSPGSQLVPTPLGNHRADGRGVVAQLVPTAPPLGGVGNQGTTPELGTGTGALRLGVGSGSVPAGDQATELELSEAAPPSPGQSDTTGACAECGRAAGKLHRVGDTWTCDDCYRYPSAGAASNGGAS